ncbi:hypothetical protein BSR28_02995 [Boudabousia liubingyangii]|uniref:YibE/F family protein n=1 Tax=Boudabousia liubingyangii TaxID=1921764 RepID=UPI00093C6A00|nr:YibE/F family protein [Boudabousia liubingyangii]OKL47485.1 hypothetical protein BSR28_02995 [Boudabousia liubingyangii]
MTSPDHEELHGHTHDHSQPLELAPKTARRIKLMLASLVLPLILATVVGMAFLWPRSVPQIGSQPLLSEGTTQAQVTVLPATATCGQAGQAADESSVCAKTEAGESVLVHVPPEVKPALSEGSKLIVLHATQEQEGPAYIYLDVERTVPLGALVIVYMVLVVAVAFKRGFLALLGLAASLAVIGMFLVPGLMAGKSPLLLTLVAVSAMIIASVYLAHGISIKTTTALLGTYFGLVVTTLLALFSTWALNLTGTGEEFQFLHTAFPGLSLTALLTCGVIVAGLGALNDVTITQASTVWELYAADPHASRRGIFASAMRVGRDHIASTVYTLAFAYAGTALPMLMLVYMVDRPWVSILTSGQVTEELARTLVASIGLVLAIPVTTAVGVALLPGVGTPRGESSSTGIAEAQELGLRQGEADATQRLTEPNPELKLENETEPRGGKYPSRKRNHD